MPIESMSRAFVLLNCDIGAENEIVSQMSGISGVSEATGVSGVYDIVAKLDADSENGISKIVTKIRSIANIRSSLTMIVAEDIND
jgi:uncharacterized protein with GYD domain